MHRRPFPRAHPVFGRRKRREGEEGHQTALGEVADIEAPLREITREAQPGGLREGEEGIEGVVFQSPVRGAEGVGQGERGMRLAGDGGRPQVGDSANRMAGVGDRSGRRGNRIGRRGFRLQAPDHPRGRPVPRRGDNVGNRIPPRRFRSFPHAPT